MNNLKNDQKQIYINLSGGLANQIFQYAFGESLRKEYDKDVFYCADYIANPLTGNYHKTNIYDSFDLDKKYFLDEGQVKAVFGPFFTPFNRKILNKIKILNFKNLYFQDEIENKMPNSSCINSRKYFHGYWQHQKFFSHSIETIQKLKFKINENLEFNKVKKFILKDEKNVFLHFRRGDYVKHKNASNLLGVVSESYYLKAINHLDNNRSLNYVVFSDDQSFAKDFCKKHLANYIVSPSWGRGNDHYDLFLMSLCRNAIIANSTFSWWGAYLGEKLNVYYPRPWYLDKHKRELDLSLSNWKVMDR